MEKQVTIYFRPCGRAGNAMFRFFQFARLEKKYTELGYKVDYSINHPPFLIKDGFLGHYLSNLQIVDVYHPHLILDGFFQHDFSDEDRAYFQKFKDSNYQIVTDRGVVHQVKEFFQVTKSPEHPVAIHIRLGDFWGICDFIPVERVVHFLATFVKKHPTGVFICEVTGERDLAYINACLSIAPGYKLQNKGMFEDFETMRRAKVLVCSMSTFSWIASLLSTDVEEVWMPQYNYSSHRPHQDFKKPIQNTNYY